MRAFTKETYVKLLRDAKKDPWPAGNCAYRKPAGHVEGKHGFDMKLLENTFRQHGFGPSLAFFGRLKQKEQIAPGLFSEHPVDQTHQYTHVDIMSAGVHHARPLRLEIAGCILRDRQGVHVRSKHSVGTVPAGVFHQKAAAVFKSMH